MNSLVCPHFLCMALTRSPCRLLSTDAVSKATLSPDKRSSKTRILFSWLFNLSVYSLSEACIVDILFCSGRILVCSVEWRECTPCTQEHSWAAALPPGYCVKAWGLKEGCRMRGSKDSRTRSELSSHAPYSIRSSQNLFKLPQWVSTLGSNYK